MLWVRFSAGADRFDLRLTYDFFRESTYDYYVNFPNQGT
jgi:hypothetical protein